MQKQPHKQQSISNISDPFKSHKQSSRLAPHLQALGQLKIFTQCIDLQIEAETTYVSNLLQFVHKLNTIQFTSDKSSNQQSAIEPYNTVIRFLQQVNNQKIHQVSAYCQQLKSGHIELKKAVEKSEQQFAKKLNELRVAQKDSKLLHQKLIKSKQKIQHTLKQSDQKLIMNEISLINPKGNKASNKVVSENILNQQKVLLESFGIMKQEFQQSMEQFYKTMRQKWKTANRYLEEVQQKFCDFVKTETIQRVSLIRNMQYDIDGFIKKCGLFDQDIEEQKKQTGQSQTKGNNNDSIKQKEKKLPKIILQKIEVQGIHNNNHVKFMALKQKIVTENQSGKKIPTAQLNKISGIQSLLQRIQNQPQESFQTTYLPSLKITEEYQTQKQRVLSAIQSYRIKNIFKFQNQQQFNNLKTLTKSLLESAYKNSDMAVIRSIFLYAPSYYYVQDQKSSKSNKKICIFDIIKESQPYLQDLLFWKFFLLSVIKQTVTNYLQTPTKSTDIQSLIGKQNPQQTGQLSNQFNPMLNNINDLHIVNAVYSALLSNSLQMIGCGLQRYDVRNVIAKSAKSFGLSQQQVTQLLKFVDNGFENWEKNKT